MSRGHISAVFQMEDIRTETFHSVHSHYSTCSLKYVQIYLSAIHVRFFMIRAHAY